VDNGLDAQKIVIDTPERRSYNPGGQPPERMTYMAEAKLKPGNKTPESGIYRPTKGGSEIAVSEGDRLPPTKPGGGWKLVTPTKKK
jgi:hypothetical protein